MVFFSHVDYFCSLTFEIYCSYLTNTYDETLSWTLPAHMSTLMHKIIQFLSQDRTADSWCILRLVIGKQFHTNVLPTRSVAGAINFIGLRSAMVTYIKIIKKQSLLKSKCYAT